MTGIDVAKWQGIINWQQVKASGIEFAILKGTNKQNKPEDALEVNYRGCMENGIPVGAYRYVYARTVSEAQKEAEELVKVLDGKKIECGVWLDMEDKSIKGVGKAGLTQIISAQQKILSAAGYKVGIYCNRDWYNNVLDSAALKEKYPFWIARYPALDTGVVKSSLSPAAYAVAWQYSSKGKVSGISGNVDMDLAFTDIRNLMQSDSSTVEPDKPTLRMGSTGIYVIMLQVGLHGAGLFEDDVTGVFCNLTREAVCKWQKLCGLVVDGICGSKTWASFGV